MVRTNYRLLLVRLFLICRMGEEGCIRGEFKREWGGKRAYPIYRPSTRREGKVRK